MSNEIDTNIYNLSFFFVEIYILCNHYDINKKHPE